MSALPIRAPLAACALALLAATAAPTVSAATFAAAATSQLSLVSVTGDASAVVFTTSDLTDESIARNGIATGFKDTLVSYTFDPLALGTGIDVFLEALVDGSASGVAPGSSVQASAIATSFLSIFNGSASAVELGLSFSYNLSAELFATPGPLLVNSGLAEAVFTLNISGSPQEQLFAFADLDLGPDADALSGSFLRTLVIGAGEQLFLDLSASTFGVAEVAVVPVPAAAWLLLSALGTGVALRRRVA
jgi:hypothetical protein